jgi:hypothetical protein
MGNIFQRRPLFIPPVLYLTDEEMKEWEEICPDGFYGNFSTLKEAVYKVDSLRITQGDKIYYILKKRKDIDINN